MALTQTENPDTKIQFYPRVINKTDIVFTEEEMSLLNRGLKYNLSYKRKYWFSNIALEAENAIMLLPVQEQCRCVGRMCLFYDNKLIGFYNLR